MEILLNRLLLACNKQVMLHGLQNGQKDARPPVICKRFGNVGVVMVQQVMYLEKPKVYRSDKESSVGRDALGFARVYLDKTANSKKRRAFLMYPVHGVLLNFSAEFRQNTIYNVHTRVGFLLSETGEDYHTVE